MSPRPAPPPRLSPKESLIVEELLRGDELYGLQLVAASRGRLKRGTVYVTLGRMEDKGFITVARGGAAGRRGRSAAAGVPRHRRLDVTSTKPGTPPPPTSQV